MMRKKVRATIGDLVIAQVKKFDCVVLYGFWVYDNELLRTHTSKDNNQKFKHEGMPAPY